MGGSFGTRRGTYRQLARDDLLDTGGESGPLVLCPSVLLLPTIYLLPRGLFQSGELCLPCLDFGAELCDCLGLVLYLVDVIICCQNVNTMGGLTVRSDLSNCETCVGDGCRAKSNVC